MNIKSFIIPFDELNVISINDTVGHALDVIKDNDFLSLPVVEGKKFIGVLSKGFVFETYFNGNYEDKDEFLKKSVEEFMKTKVPVLENDMLIEDAADLFLGKKVKFIPIVNKRNELEGIITPSCLIQIYKKIFGSDLPRIIIFTHDFKGKLAKIAETVSKSGGNIKNIVQVDTEIMDLQEIYLRIEADDIKKIIKHLEHHGFDVREYS